MFLPLPAHSAHHEQIILITILKKRQQKGNTVNIGCPLRKVSIHSLLVLCIEQLYVNYCGLTKMRFNLLLSRGSTACDVSRVQRIITFLQYIIKRFWSIFLCRLWNTTYYNEQKQHESLVLKSIKPRVRMLLEGSCNFEECVRVVIWKAFSTYLITLIPTLVPTLEAAAIRLLLW